MDSINNTDFSNMSTNSMNTKTFLKSRFRYLKGDDYLRHYQHNFVKMDSLDFKEIQDRIQDALKWDVYPERLEKWVYLLDEIEKISDELDLNKCKYICIQDGHDYVNIEIQSHPDNIVAYLDCSPMHGNLLTQESMDIKDPPSHKCIDNFKLKFQDFKNKLLNWDTKTYSMVAVGALIGIPFGVYLWNSHKN